MGFTDARAGNRASACAGYVGSHGCNCAFQARVLREHQAAEWFLTGGIYSLSLHLPSIMPIRAVEFGSDPLVVFFTLFKVHDHEKNRGKEKKKQFNPACL